MRPGRIVLRIEKQETSLAACLAQKDSEDIVLSTGVFNIKNQTETGGQVSKIT
jgi:hypothetical protein